MPRITVKYLMRFSEITGTRSEEMEVDDGETVAGLLKRLGDRYGREFTEAFGEDLGSRSAVVAVNGEFAETEDVIKEGDEVVISYPVGGG